MTVVYCRERFIGDGDVVEEVIVLEVEGTNLDLGGNVDDAKGVEDRAT